MARVRSNYKTIGEQAAQASMAPQRTKDRVVSESLRLLLSHGDKLFSQRQTLDGFWQECALNFYPEVATFTNPGRDPGDEFCDHLTTSYPVIARRSLGDAISALLRPVNLDSNSPGVWFGLHLQDPRIEDQDALRWLDWATSVMYRAMYDRVSQFLKAVRQTDHGFVTFGQWPMSIGLGSPNRGHLIYQSHHLRDVVWCENGMGEITHVQRRWKAKAVEVASTFGRDTAPQVLERMRDEPYTDIECRHIVISSEEFTDLPTRKAWISIWIDKTNNYVMRYEGTDCRTYIIPRWVGIPGSQYATSPAVTASLPDARLLQAMALTLLDAAEKFADPPMAAVQEAIRSDVSLFPGGITYLDAEYDERLGDALRPVYQPTAGQNLSGAFQLQSDLRDQLFKAFYLDSLALPPPFGSREMTAYEVGARMSEWIRRAMPIFESIEYDYNAMLCEETFGVMLRAGGFGTPSTMPPSLSGQSVQFRFSSPLHESSEQRKAQQLMSASALLMQISQVDPSVIPLLSAETALREVLNGTCPPTWVASKEEVQTAQQAQAQQQQEEQQAKGMVTGAEVAKNVAKAMKDAALQPTKLANLADAGSAFGAGGST